MLVLYVIMHGIMEMIGFVVLRYSDESKNQFSYRIKCQQQLTQAKSSENSQFFLMQQYHEIKFE